VAERARAAGAERVDDATRARLWARYQRLLADGQAANLPPRPARCQDPRQRRSPAAKLLARLDTHRDEVLRLLDDCRVPFDNNQAERDLRMVKLQQKISGCWRTPPRRPGVPNATQLRLDRSQAGHEPPRRAAPAIPGQTLAAHFSTVLNSYTCANVGGSGARLASWA
jgi:hypothetical protein